MDSSPNKSTADEVILSFAGYFPVTVPKLSVSGTGIISIKYSIIKNSQRHLSQRGTKMQNELKVVHHLDNDVQVILYANAQDELDQMGWYDYIVVNTEIEEATRELTSIIIAERCKTARVLQKG